MKMVPTPLLSLLFLLACRSSCCAAVGSDEKHSPRNVLRLEQERTNNKFRGGTRRRHLSGDPDPTCPATTPTIGSSCTVEGQECAYGTETCCGQTYDSLIIFCADGVYQGYYTDACLVPTCPGGCFSASDTVQVQAEEDFETEGGKVVAMKDLSVGDRVLVDPEKQIYEPVYAFGHYSTTARMRFVQISFQPTSASLISANSSTALQPLVELTADHLVYVVDGHNNKKRNLVRADQVRRGDYLLSTTASGTVVIVTKIAYNKEKKQGLFMPLTPSGKLVVNHVLASNYVSIRDSAPGVVEHPLLEFWLSEHMLSHAWMTPVRLVCTRISSKKLCPGMPSSGENDGDNEQGILPWLLFGKAFAEWGDRQPLLIQLVVGIPLVMVLGVLLSVEFLMGLALSLVAIMLPKLHVLKSYS
jgi:hypothetical protein